jgi:hypothetical protein
LHVKTTTNTFALLNEARLYIFPSVPKREKSGADAPIGSVGCSPAGRVKLVQKSNKEKRTVKKELNFIRHILCAGNALSQKLAHFPQNAKI